MRQDLLSFANRLKELREEKGFSYRALAEELDISKSALQKYESAITDPSLTVVKKIADYFDVEIDWLIGEAKIRRRTRLKKMA